MKRYAEDLNNNMSNKVTRVENNPKREDFHAELKSIITDKNSDIKVLEQLIDKHQINCNEVKFETERKSDGPIESISVLNFAVTMDNVNILNELLEKYKVDDIGDEKGNKAIHFAAMNGKVESLKYLLDRDIKSLNKSNNEGQTPLYAAANYGRAEVVKELVKLGADVNAPMADGPNKGLTPLYAATFKGHAEVVKKLVKLGAELTAPMADG